jgi:hypothetical protein
MTLPEQELAALKRARRFLFDLLDPKVTPRVPRAVRDRASRCLRHFPYEVILEERYGLIDEPTDAQDPEASA